MKDESIVNSSRYGIWLAVLPACLVSMMFLLAGGAFYFEEGRAVQDRSLTAFLLAFGGVALFLSMISFGRSYSSAIVRGNILVIRNRGAPLRDSARTRSAGDAVANALPGASANDPNRVFRSKPDPRRRCGSRLARRARRLDRGPDRAGQTQRRAIRTISPGVVLGACFSKSRVNPNRRSRLPAKYP